MNALNFGWICVRAGKYRNEPTSPVFDSSVRIA